jgi:hydrogenase expression/formation protein HypC
MCLAIPGKIITIEGDDAVVDFQGNRVRVCSVLTPGVKPNDWVLVHAGFSIAPLDETAAKRTWDYLNQIADADVTDMLGDLSELVDDNTTDQEDSSSLPANKA